MSGSSLPIEETTIDGLLRNAASQWPSAVAIQTLTDGRELQFKELDGLVDVAARSLTALGIDPGERVAVMMHNCVEYPVVWLACARVGAVMVPINHRFGVADAGYCIEHAAVSLVIVDESSALVAEQASDRAPKRPKVAHVSELSTGGSVLDFVPRAETIVNIQYTSGTSGRPKGCMLSNNYWMTMARKNVLEVPGLDGTDTLLTAQPFSYMDPQWNLVSALAVGAKLAVLDAFHPTTFWESVARSGTTFFYCLGVMPALMLRSPATRYEKEHQVRIVACSGINPAVHAELEERFGIPWVETYGMTEIGNGLAVYRADHDPSVGSGRMGRATRSREVRVVDEDDRPLSRGSIGELIVRGVGLMEGYFNDPTATAAAFRNGWFHTGDQVWLDDDGFAHFVGRRKDMIRRSGENISAVEVEEALGTHAAVEIAVCVAVPDPIRGEEVKAYVVLAPEWSDDIELKESALAEHCLDLIAAFKVPRYWHYVDSVPLTQSEKVQKSALVGQVDDLRIDSWDRVDRVWR